MSESPSRNPCADMTLPAQAAQMRIIANTTPYMVHSDRELLRCVADYLEENTTND